MPEAAEILRKYYGYNKFKPGQEEIIASILGKMIPSHNADRAGNPSVTRFRRFCCLV